MRSAATLILSLILVLPLGCSEQTATFPGNTIVPPPPATPRDALATPQSLAVEPASRVEVTAHKDIGGEDTETAALAVTGGDVVMHALSDGTLIVDRLTVSLADVQVPSMSFGLTGMKLTLMRQTPADAAWATDGASAAGTAAMELQVEWSLVAYGNVLPLSRIRLDAVPMMLAVSGKGAERIDVTFQGQREGVFWEWAGLVQLSDLGIHLEADKR